MFHYDYKTENTCSQVISLDLVGNVVHNVSTAALIKSTHKQVAKLLAEKHIPFADEEFACKGSFAMLHKGKPDGSDCKAAAAFLKKIVLYQ